MDEPRNDAVDLSDDDMPYESEMKLPVYATKFLKDRISRRGLLKAGGLTGLSLSALWALACQPTTPVVTPAKPAAPVAPAPTPKIGRQLIGKLEGPVVITDVAKWPKAFKEAPALAELVKAGKLPPVKERIGEDPLVLKPLHETGKYGGTWRRGFTGPTDYSNGLRAVQHDKLLFYDYTGTKIVPHMAKGWEVSADGKTTLLFLRRGMKWSDGAPFTADDFTFWYQDMYLNKDLNPSPMPVMVVEGKPVVIEKADTYTVRFKSEAPYYLLPVILAAVLGLGHHARFGRLGTGGLAPAHYLKQFHPKYVAKAELDKKVAEAKMDNWRNLLLFKNSSHLNTELPVMTAWKLSSPANTPIWGFERNPYSVWVDTEGNQLPYIDKVSMTLAENLEVLNLRAIAGEYDKQARHIDLVKLPIFLENEKKANYKVYLDPSDQGADVGLYVNMSFEADPEIAKWLTNKDFRIALSLGIERDQINETFVLGLSSPGSAVPGEGNLYFPGPEYVKLHSTYDPKKANEMLDKLGLDKKDAEGFRLRTDGKGRLRFELWSFLGFLQFTQMGEMIREQWKKIGIQVDVTELERSLKGRREANNEHHISMETQWGADEPWGHFPTFFPYDRNNRIGPLYGHWFQTDGKAGKEPPPRMRQVMDMYKKAFGVPEKERIQLGKEMWKIVVDDIWTISVVRNSPASQGVRVVKNYMGNVPQRHWNSAVSDNPWISHPETMYFKT